MSASDSLRHALQKCEIEYAPDPRLTVFEVSAERDLDEITLSGTVLTDDLKARAVETAERVADAPVSASDVTVLEADERERTVSSPHAPVRADPEADAEQVTQVLYGAQLSAYDREGDSDDWRRVRTPGGYVAWVRRTHLAEPTEIDAEAVVTAGAVGDEGDGDGTDPAEDADESTLYAGTECEMLDDEEGGPEAADDEVSVRFRTGAERTLPADAVAAIPDRTSGEAVAETARKYLGTEYEWGGMTVGGIDCSGLTSMAYHRHGVALPRDADLQRRMGETVARDEVSGDDLEAGDLLFFPGHVALSLGGARFVHAYGNPDEVVVGSLDPEDDQYEPDLDESFALATRLV